HASEDHPRSAAAVISSSIEDSEKSITTGIDGQTAAVVMPPLVDGAPGHDPALDLMEVSISWSSDDLPLSAQSSSMRFTHTPESVLLSHDGPTDCAGAVATQAIVLLSAAIRSGLPVDLSNEKMLDVGPFPMLAEWNE